jgi:predicted HicB family RNase H-like nuclease
MDIGKIYILKNESLPNQYKIGRTINDMKTRIYGYSLMKLDHKFVCIFEEQHFFHSILERFIHGELLESRIRGEYFKFSDDDSAINAVLTSINKFANITEGLTDLEEVKKIAAPKKKKTDSGITSLRMPDGLLRQLTKAAHKCEVSRTEYINQALQAAVNKTLEIRNDTKTD